MTLYHFGNCVALVYAPYHMAYKYSGIQEYASLSKCVYAGMLYIFTQLCKMLLLATFFPDSDGHQAGGEYDVFMELLKATVDFADFIGIYFALNSVPGKGHAKILTVAIGWASAEVLVSRSIPLWVGARGAEFSWKHIRSAAEANVCLIESWSRTALTWLAARTSRPNSLNAPLLILLLISPYWPLLLQAVATIFSFGPWSLLAIRAVHASAIGLTTLAMYTVVAAQLG